MLPCLIATGSRASESDQTDDSSSDSSSVRSLSSEEDIIETDYHDPVSPVLYLCIGINEALFVWRLRY